MTSDNELTQRLKKQQRVMLFLFILVVTMPILYKVWEESNISIVKVVEMDPPVILGSSDLCAGDKLTFSYNLHIRGTGVLIRDLTVWKVNPPKTVVFSDALRFIVDAPIDQELIESYAIPYFYRNRETSNLEKLPPGKYRRLIAISSPANYKVVAIEGVDFTIREDC